MMFFIFSLKGIHTQANCGKVYKKGKLMAKIFGKEHIIYMIISFAIIIAALILIKRFCKTEKAKKIAVKVSGAVQLVVVLLNNIFLYQWVHRIELVSLCGTISLLFAIFVLVCKKDSSCLHFVTYTGLIAGLVATIYPTYLNQGPTIFFPSTITSLMHHSLTFYLAVLMLSLGYVVPDIKKWKAWPIGYCCLLVYGLFNIKIRGRADSMYINNPVLAGTNLNWFYMGLLFLLAYTIFLIIFDAIKNKKDCFVIVACKNIKDKFKSQSKVDKSSSE